MQFNTLFRCWRPCLSVFLWGLVSGLWLPMCYANTEAGTITLQTAIAKTLAQNPQLYQYRFIKDAALAEKQTHLLRPALALELDVENMAGSGSTGAETTVALSSVIEMGGKRKARMDLMDAKINHVQWQQQAATLDVLGELTRTYIQGLASQENIQLAEDCLRLSQSLLQTVKNRAARGATPEAEVMRAQAALTRAEIRLSALVNLFERQKIFIAHYWGEKTPSFKQLTGNLFEFGASESFEQLYERVHASPAIKIFATNAQVKEAEVTLARAKGQGDVAWRAGVQHFEETGDSAFAIGVSVPLFTHKRNQGEVAETLAERNAVDADQKNALLLLHAKLYEVWSVRKQSVEAAYKTRRFVIPALEQALQLTQKAYEDGRYRYLDLVAAQEELLAAKQALIDAATRALVSQATIEQLTNEALTH